jgi:hypothetical protein
LSKMARAPETTLDDDITWSESQETAEKIKGIWVIYDCGVIKKQDRHLYFRDCWGKGEELFCQIKLNLILNDMAMILGIQWQKIKEYFPGVLLVASELKLDDWIGFYHVVNATELWRRFQRPHWIHCASNLMKRAQQLLSESLHIYPRYGFSCINLPNQRPGSKPLSAM